jgi:hypothetical protein
MIGFHPTDTSPQAVTIPFLPSPALVVGTLWANKGARNRPRRETPFGCFSHRSYTLVDKPGIIEVMAEETTTARFEARLPNDVHALLKRAL